MKYHIDYQHMAKGDARPRDDGAVVEIEFDSEQGFAVIPAVGDYVEIIPLGSDVTAFSGKVSSRLFRYFLRKDGTEKVCSVNIVVQDSDDDWGLLVKE